MRAINQFLGHMTTLTLERARVIVAHAENEFGADYDIPDAFAPFARGGASTRAEASNALYIVIADFYCMASWHGASSPAMQEFSDYARLSGLIALRLTRDAIDSPEALQAVASTDSRETIDSFVRYLRSRNPQDSDFMPSVYRRIGLTYPTEPTGEPARVTAPNTNKPWWRFW
jgi:hypothetical protein